MKISNETKIGSLTAIAIALLFFGFNFLKGKDLFVHSKKIYAVFSNVEGVELSNAVKINGLQIGNVYSISETDRDMRGILVTINLKKDVRIPKNSVASISSELINSSSVIISKGDAGQYLEDGDTIQTSEKVSLMAQVQQNVSPIVAKLSHTLQSLDSLVVAVGSMFDPKAKNNFSSILAHLAESSGSLQAMLNTQTGALAQSLNNVNAFTGNLSKNNDQVTKTLDNMQKATGKLADSKIQETVETLQSTMNELKVVVNKLNSGTGSLGLLLNDKKLYQNLESSSRSMNILLDDFRLHPKRYVNVSVFGKKDKTAPLTAPLSDSAAKPASK